MVMPIAAMSAAVMAVQSQRLYWRRGVAEEAKPVWASVPFIASFPSSMSESWVSAGLADFPLAAAS
jgi:hypothetical protein